MARITKIRKRTRYTAQAVIEIRERIERGDGWRAILLDALTAQERRVYQAVQLGLGNTSTDIARLENISLTHASSMLNQLEYYGVLTRRKVIDSDGKLFVYEVNNG
jgi:hypothetical protein